MFWKRNSFQVRLWTWVLLRQHGMWVSTVSDPVPPCPFWAEKDAHVSSSRKLGAHAHLQGCICGNLADPGQWVSSMSCVYIWVKLHRWGWVATETCGWVFWLPNWGLVWERMDVIVEGEKAPDLACLGPWLRRGNRTNEFSERKLGTGCMSVVPGRVFGEWLLSVSPLRCLYKTDVNFNLHRLTMQKTESTGVRKCQNEDVQILWNISALMNICIKWKILKSACELYLKKIQNFLQKQCILSVLNLDQLAKYNVELMYHYATLHKPFYLLILREQ